MDFFTEKNIFLLFLDKSYFYINTQQNNHTNICQQRVCRPSGEIVSIYASLASFFLSKKCEWDFEINTRKLYAKFRIFIFLSLSRSCPSVTSTFIFVNKLEKSGPSIKIKWFSSAVFHFLKKQK